jgi:hypothetical protein
MPFKPIKKGKNKGKYSSPNGRIFTDKQVKLYYASGGFDKRKLALIKLGKGMRGEK